MKGRAVVFVARLAAVNVWRWLHKFVQLVLLNTHSSTIMPSGVHLWRVRESSNPLVQIQYWGMCPLAVARDLVQM